MQMLLSGLLSLLCRSFFGYQRRAVRWFVPSIGIWRVIFLPSRRVIRSINYGRDEVCASRHSARVWAKFHLWNVNVRMAYVRRSPHIIIKYIVYIGERIFRAAELEYLFCVEWSALLEQHGQKWRRNSIMEIIRVRGVCRTQRAQTSRLSVVPLISI